MPTRFRTVVERAEAFLRLAHAGRKRADGRPHADFPLAVRDILVAELNVADEDVLVAALLHDVADETRVPLSEVGERFGPAVERRVRALSLTADPDVPADERDARHLARLREADTPTRQIKIAASLHRLREAGRTATPTVLIRYLEEADQLVNDVLIGTPGIDLLRAERERQGHSA